MAVPERVRGALLEYDYDGVCQSLVRLNRIMPTQFRGMFVSWDNSARAGRNARIFLGSTPKKYEVYLRKQINRTLGNPEEKSLVFINAWNEWGEGCYLEPDERYGRAYLEATKRALEK
jgi:hypothetical protein